MSLCNEVDKLGLFGSYGGSAGLLGLAGTGFDHGHVGSRSDEEYEDEWPDLKGGLVGVTRCVSSAEEGWTGFVGNILGTPLRNWCPGGYQESWIDG